jgi:ketosteroid isomerase-like protein
MVNRDAIAKLIKDAYAARVAKDVDGAMEFFAPDATFQFGGSAAASPTAVRVRGTADLRATFSALIATFDILEGENAAMHWRVRVKYNPTGEVHDTELFDLWTITGGRATSFVQFADTALLAKLMAK